MTQEKQLSFPPIPAFSNWCSLTKHPDSNLAEPVAYPELAPIMAKKTDFIQQRHVTRVVKGAVAGGFRVTSVKVDKDGSIVLSSGSTERDEREEPRLPNDSNEWDEVLKK